MRNFIIMLTFSLLSYTSAYAQGNQVIINKYAGVLAYNLCFNRLVVDDATDFNVGDTILIIQMKGASIDSSNTIAFGSIVTYNSAGNYELNTVKAKNGNNLYLNYNLQRSYDIPHGKVQIVRVPYYQSYTVSQPHTCTPWDGTKGGVFAVNVANYLMLNNSIDVTGRGFSGGTPLLSSLATCNKTDYFYPSVDNFGAQKGEGISSLSAAKMYGRGALANGGGGGNDHNGGGAGGGNGGEGGLGGNQHPFGGCSTPIILDVGGVGGKGLLYSSTANKVFLGGGGGAGHGNNLGEKSGGTGGGIVIISANVIIGNNNVIVADGADAPECTAPAPGCQDDGMGGGGAGGSILISTTSVSGTLTTRANGGKGGNAYESTTTSPAYKTGPGGGGGGGVVWLSSPGVQALVNVSTIGGLSGIIPQFSSDNYGALPGQPGLVHSDLQYSFPTSASLGTVMNYSVKDSLIACKEVLLIAQNNGGSSAASFQWTFGDGESATGNPVTHLYTTPGSYSVTLIIKDSSGCIDTLSHGVFVDDVTADFTVVDDTICQGQSIAITNASSSNSTFYAWNFGDGSVDSSFNPTHQFTSAGVYDVSLIVGNGIFCRDTAYRIIVVDSISGIDFTLSDSILCEGRATVFRGVYAQGTSRSIEWSLGDGFAINGVDMISHAYDSAGTYTINAVAHFRRCPDASISRNIIVKPFPQLNLGPDTSMCPNGPAVVLSDQTNAGNQNATWLWNTGEVSNSISVRHPGIFTAQVDLEGCKTNDSVEVFKACYIDIPNVFSPNNDGVNDYFFPRQSLSRDVVGFTMTIFNRWGQIIFETAKVDGRGWDGRFNGKDQPVGVYVYMIDVIFKNGAKEKYTGNVTLLR